MWEFQLRRGAVELTNRGMGYMNSPVVVTDAAKRLVAEFRQELQDFYRRHAHPPSDADLAFEIEQVFGARLVHDVCVPNGIYEGACLIIAMAVAREGCEPAPCPT